MWVTVHDGGGPGSIRPERDELARVFDVDLGGLGEHVAEPIAMVVETVAKQGPSRSRDIFASGAHGTSVSRRCLSSKRTWSAARSSSAVAVESGEIPQVPSETRHDDTLRSSMSSTNDSSVGSCRATYTSGTRSEGLARLGRKTRPPSCPSGLPRLPRVGPDRVEASCRRSRWARRCAPRTPPAGGHACWSPGVARSHRPSRLARRDSGMRAHPRATLVQCRAGRGTSASVTRQVLAPPLDETISRHAHDRM